MVGAERFRERAAVLFRPEDPFTFTSGLRSPVYIDCRRLISFPRARTKLMDLGAELIERHAGYEGLDAIAGGETAGIPFAAWIADRLSLPMLYVRKQPKGFGRNAQIEGELRDEARVLLVEDLASEGTSKLNFVRAIRCDLKTRDGEFVAVDCDRHMRRLVRVDPDDHRHWSPSS